MKKAFKRLLPAIIISLAGSFVCICCALTVIPAKSETVSHGTPGIVRFRVVANSDTPYDQQLKIKVRDGLESTVKMLFSDCKSPKEIKSVAEKHKELLVSKAQQILAENGEYTSVNVRFVTEKADVRRYDGLVLPAGEYMTLRIDIGKAEGQNWWCVLYPSSFLDAAFDKDASDIVSDGGEEKGKTKNVRFALFDLFS